MGLRVRGVNKEKETEKEITERFPMPKSELILEAGRGTDGRPDRQNGGRTHGSTDRHGSVRRQVSQSVDWPF